MACTSTCFAISEDKDDAADVLLAIVVVVVVRTAAAELVKYLTTVGLTLDMMAARV